MADTATLAKPATLWTALAAFQAAAPKIQKAAQGNRGKYAPLDAVLDAVRPGLAAHSLSVVQLTRMQGDVLVVDTRIVHAPTGEHIEATYPVGAALRPHQELGAALTYARRYAILAALGLCPAGEDREQPARKQDAPPPADLKKAADTLMNRLMQAKNTTELQRVWQAQTKLRGALDEREPDLFRRLEATFSERVHELYQREQAQ